MNVLSLFDGMSCGQIALNKAGIKYDNYYASEIDKHSIKITKKNYPNTIHIGDVREIQPGNLPKIDLLIGGSPCQSFSFAGKMNGMSGKGSVEILSLEHYLELKVDGFEFDGESYLFWEYMRILNEVKPKYFLLENVMMVQKWETVLSKAIGIGPLIINSSLVSAQNRKRLYWTNIGAMPSGLFGFVECQIPQPKDKGVILEDILEDEVDDKYFLKKFNTSYTSQAHQIHEGKKTGCISAGPHGYALGYVIHNRHQRSGDPANGGTGPLKRSDGKTYCVDTYQSNALEIIKRDVIQVNPSKESGGQQPYQQNRVYDSKGIITCLDTEGGRKSIFHESKIRRLTPIECERLQTVPDDYTKGVSDTQRYKMIGNGWTIDIIEHIFNHLK